MADLVQAKKIIKSIIKNWKQLKNGLNTISLEQAIKDPSNLKKNISYLTSLKSAEFMRASSVLNEKK